MSQKTHKFSPLFADITGGKFLIEKLGHAEAVQALERCFNRMERAVTTFKGRVAKRSGSHIMAVFGNAEEALRAACEMQERVETLPAVSGIKLAIGIGFHYGTLQDENNDVFGETVNIASRLVKQARLGQIVTSGAAIATFPASLRQMTRALDLPPIKNKNEDVGIFEVLWKDIGNAPAVGPVSTVCLRLRHGDREILMNTTAPLITLGRNERSDLVIKDQRASRNHCRIEMRRDGFVLLDISTNGTFVSPHDGADFYLKQGATTLKGSGRLCFGQAFFEDIPDLVDYEVCQEPQ
jgi:GGDEF domain-containing protein